MTYNVKILQNTRAGVSKFTGTDFSTMRTCAIYVQSSRFPLRRLEIDVSGCKAMVLVTFPENFIAHVLYGTGTVALSMPRVGDIIADDLEELAAKICLENRQPRQGSKVVVNGARIDLHDGALGVFRCWSRQLGFFDVT